MVSSPYVALDDEILESDLQLLLLVLREYDLVGRLQLQDVTFIILGILLDYLSKYLLHSCGFHTLYMLRSSLLFEPTELPLLESKSSKRWSNGGFLETILISNIIVFCQYRNWIISPGKHTL